MREGAFLVNYALGVGMLGTPYAFYKSGLVLSVVFMVGITAIGIVTAMWIVEVRACRTAMIPFIARDLSSSSPGVRSGKCSRACSSRGRSRCSIRQYCLPR